MTCISLSILNQEQEVRKAKIDDSDSLKRVNYYRKRFCLFSCSGLSITRRRCDSSLFRYAQYLFNGEVRCYA